MRDSAVASRPGSLLTCTTVSSAWIAACLSSSRRNASLKGFRYISAIWTTQLAIVFRFSSTPIRFHICSCRYSGSASAYFFTMMSVTTDAEA